MPITLKVRKCCWLYSSNVWINANAVRAGMSWEESKPLFDKLWAHMTQDKYIMTVYWENNGDIVGLSSMCILIGKTIG